MFSPETRFNRTRFVEDIATLLHLTPSELVEIDDPYEAGLDSLRLMVLVEQWRTLGVNVTFIELASLRSLAGWWALIQPRVQINPT